MPNTYIKAKKFAALAVGLLERDSLLPECITRMGGDQFIGAENDTVTFRLPGITTARDYEWRTRTAPIVLDTIGRTAISIKLDTHSYSAVSVTDEEFTLDVTDFASEVVEPQMAALRDRQEGKVLAALAAEPFKNITVNALAADDPFAYALKMKGILDTQGTPAAGRKLIVGVNVYNWLMMSTRLVNMDRAQASQAYREAVTTRIAGFDIVSSGLLGANDIYGLHNTWGILANLAPEVPLGVVYGARTSYKGYSLRAIRDYDPNFARDRSFINTFTGISGVRDEYLRAANGSLTLDVNGNPQLTGKNVRGAKGVFTP